MQRAAAHRDAADVADAVAVNLHQRCPGAHRHDDETVQAAVEAGSKAVGAELELQPRKRGSEIRFRGQDILSGNWLFKQLILKPDTKAGLRSYEANR